MDAEWSTPSIFQFNRGRPKDNTRSFDLESMDRLDYLIYCLKQEGIYIYLDLLTYRQFRPGDGVDAVDELLQAAKPYTYFDPRLIELQKEFNRDLWTHINPYTGLAYKDDPAIALTELKNESDPFCTAGPGAYRSRLEALYRAWAEGKELLVDEAKVDFAHPTDQVARFLLQVMKDYYRGMIAHLRDIGVKVPVNGTNWSINLAVTAAQLAADFADFTLLLEFPPVGESGHANPADGGRYRQHLCQSSYDAHAGSSLLRLRVGPRLAGRMARRKPTSLRRRGRLSGLERGNDPHLPL